MRRLQSTVPAVLMALAASSLAELPPAPVPAENPVTEQKRILGKILFWDEQLSFDDSIACGSCHRPSAGGSDPRSGVHPGELPGSFDDVAGSPGIRRFDRDGNLQIDPVFGGQAQITPRLAPSIFGALWASEIFWDGRAQGRLIDPATGSVVIESGGALENQALMTLASNVEMSKSGHSWTDLERKLARVKPLGLADRWPADVSEALQAYPGYPELFANAFGDPSITAVRIAMAIASYERTLVPDRAPIDSYLAGDTAALSRNAVLGWQSFQSQRCTECHRSPLFSNNAFVNIGLRSREYDPGRADVTESDQDAGAMKVPSLRNVGLRSRFMHTGEFRALSEAISFYTNPPLFADVDEMPDGGSYAFTMSQLTMVYVRSFLIEALTDPRVAAEQPPFDRPRLATER